MTPDSKHGKWRMVPVAAIKWLFGEAPDEKGNWFGDGEDAKKGNGSYWWRRPFRKMLQDVTEREIPTKWKDAAENARHVYDNRKAQGRDLPEIRLVGEGLSVWLLTVDEFEALVLAAAPVAPSSGRDAALEEAALEAGKWQVLVSDCDSALMFERSKTAVEIASAIRALRTTAPATEQRRPNPSPGFNSNIIDTDQRLGPIGEPDHGKTTLDRVTEQLGKKK